MVSFMFLWGVGRVRYMTRHVHMRTHHLLQMRVFGLNKSMEVLAREGELAADASDRAQRAVQLEHCF